MKPSLGLHSRGERKRALGLGSVSFSSQPDMKSVAAQLPPVQCSCAGLQLRGLAAAQASSSTGVQLGRCAAVQACSCGGAGVATWRADVSPDYLLITCPRPARGRRLCGLALSLSRVAAGRYVDKCAPACTRKYVKTNEIFIQTIITLSIHPSETFFICIHEIQK